MEIYKNLENKKENFEKPKPCCACPETRKARDECIFEKGEENCIKYIELHKECMKGYGYIV